MKNLFSILFNSNQKTKNHVSDTYLDDVYCLERSEILDDKTCNFCLSMDGRTFAKDDPIGNTDEFCKGCRGIWAEVLNDQSIKPEIDQIPSELLKCIKGGKRSMMGLKKPIVDENSPAWEELERRKSDKK